VAIQSPGPARLYRLGPKMLPQTAILLRAKIHNYGCSSTIRMALPGNGKSMVAAARANAAHIDLAQAATRLGGRKSRLQEGVNNENRLTRHRKRQPRRNRRPANRTSEMDAVACL